MEVRVTDHAEPSREEGVTHRLHAHEHPPPAGWENNWNC
nr:MAG TPA: hypothetical protein [Caudoviricetes sp.]